MIWKRILQWNILLGNLPSIKNFPCLVKLEYSAPIFLMVGSFSIFQNCLPVIASQYNQKWSNFNWVHHLLWAIQCPINLHVQVINIRNNLFLCALKEHDPSSNVVIAESVGSKSAKQVSMHKRIFLRNNPNWLQAVREEEEPPPEHVIEPTNSEDPPGTLLLLEPTHLSIQP